MLKPGDAHHARTTYRALRWEILRQSRWLLLLVAIGIALGLYGFASGLPLLPAMADTESSVLPVDGTLLLILVFGAVALPFALLHGERRSGNLLRRLPVAPQAILRARLEIGLVAALLILAALFTVEYVSEPDLMKPNISGRLNPFEARTLKALPGIPLLRFELDGQTYRALTSDHSLAAVSRIGAEYYGADGWSGIDLEIPKPGEILDARPVDLRLAEWPNSFWSGLPLETKKNGPEKRASDASSEGPMLTVTLERYVPKDEYLAQPWRRDGLFRDRQWHAVDRVVGFLGLFVVALALGSLSRTQAGSIVILSLLGVMPIGLYPGVIHLKPAIFASDVLRYGSMSVRPTFPSLAPLHHQLEAWVWPALVGLISCAIYALSSFVLRREAFGQDPLGSGFWSRVGRNLGGIGRFWITAAFLSPFLIWAMADFDLAIFSRLPIVIALLSFQGVVWTRILAARMAKSQLTNLAITPYLKWGMLALAISALVAALAFQTVMRGGSQALIILQMVMIGGILATLVWRRSEALLSRLPVRKGRIVLRRLAVVLLLFALLALLPMSLELAFDHFFDHHPYLASDSHFGGERVCYEDADLLENFGAVPLLHVIPKDGSSFFRDWHPSPTVPFLPRDRVFWSISGALRSQDSATLRIGQRIEGVSDSFEIVGLLESKEEVEAFLSEAEFLALGPVPGNIWLPRFLLTIVTGFACLFLALLLPSPRIAWMAAIALLVMHLNTAFFSFDFSTSMPRPSPVWWIGVILLGIALFVACFVLMKMRLAQGGPLHFSLPKKGLWRGINRPESSLRTRSATSK